MGHAVNDGTRKPWANPVVRIAVWALVGGIVGYFGGMALAKSKLLAAHDDGLNRWFDSVGVSGFIGLMLTAMLVLLGLYLLILTLLPDAAVIRAMKADADEDMQRPRRMLRIAGAGSLGYAAMIAVFVLPGIDPLVGMIVGGVAFAIVTGLFFLGMKISDELERAAQNEGMSWSFIIVEAAVVGWALLHHFGQAGPIDPLAAVLFVTLVYYAAAVVSSVRRGMVQ